MIAVDPGAVSNQQQQGRSMRSRLMYQWITAGAVTAGVMLHGVWLAIASFNLNLEIFDQDDQAEPLPHVSFMGNPEAIEHEVRLIRSPVLFSLPSPVGFSGPLLKPADLHRLPEFERESLLLLRPLDEPFQSSRYGVSSRDLLLLAKQKRPVSVPPPMDETAILMDEGEREENTFLIYWLDRPGAVLNTIPIPKGTAWAGSSPWDMILLICFDQTGYMEHVFVEKPAPAADINDAALRISRQLISRGFLTETCDRLVIKYIPAPVKQGI